MDEHLSFFENYVPNADGRDFEGFERSTNTVPENLESSGYERQGNNSIFSSIPSDLHTIDDWSIDQDRYN